MDEPQTIKPPHLMNLADLAATIRGCLSARPNRGKLTMDQRLILWELAAKLDDAEKDSATDLAISTDRV